MEKEKIKLKDVIELLPRRISLTYVDYRDSLDDHEELLAECIRSNSLDSLNMYAYEWFNEQECESVNEVKKELVKDIVDSFDVDEYDAKQIVEEYDDYLTDAIYERRDDNYVDDLIRNTRDFVVFYDTGENFDGYGNSAAQYRLDRMRIKKLFSITDSKYDHHIDMMLMQASYGGSLVVYFNAGFKDLINEGKEFKSIKFSNAAIAIIDTGGGSGDHCYLEGHSFTLPFNRERLFVERTVHYNYTYEVCGMSSDWCDRTGFTLLEESVPCELSESSLNSFMEREAKLDAVFKSGKCTFLDMNYKRHRRLTYINDFPCGNKCLDCGTFWID